jgi:hypothetical protein
MPNTAGLWKRGLTATNNRYEEFPQCFPRPAAGTCPSTFQSSSLNWQLGKIIASERRGAVVGNFEMVRRFVPFEFSKLAESGPSCLCLACWITISVGRLIAKENQSNPYKKVSMSIAIAESMPIQLD